jgi:choline dehydrogenase-like flavoprotein
VLTGTRTTKLAFESDNSGTPRTVGVEFSQASVAAGDRYAVELAPGGEVLLCSGAIHSPHLLQLSGESMRVCMHLSADYHSSQPRMYCSACSMQSAGELP